MIKNGGSKNLATFLTQQLHEVDSRMSELGSQREQNHRYYSLQPLGNEISGRSKYISADVLDVVESLKSYFTETFMSARQTCKFEPGQQESQQDADAKTDYVEQQLDKNDWYQLFRDGLHDAFVAKRLVYHVEWLDEEDTTILDATGAQPEHLQWQIQQMADVINVDGSEVQQGPEGLTGTVRIKTDTSRVNIRLIQPERYYRDPYATYPQDALFCAYEEDVSRFELIEQGFDPEQVENLTDDLRFRREEEDNARKSHDSSWTRRRQFKRDKEQDQVTTFWTYTWLSLAQYQDDAPEDVRLYKIRWCRGEVLRYEDGSEAIEEISEMPFFEWAQHKISHAENGLCAADIVAHTQKTNSTLKRLTIDNQQMRNASRYEAVKGAISNPRDLLDTSIGGVIWVQQPGSVSPLQAPELSPMTGQIIEMLEQDKESRTGSSRLAKGLNQDAISQQNSGSMIERLTNNSNRRIMSQCRDYAETLLIPLMKQIYRLGVRNDQRMYQVEVTGQQMQVSPQQWQEPAPTCNVAVALTPDEGAQHAQQLMMLHQMMSMDPVLGSLYGVQQRHALFDEMFEAIGVPDTARFMMVPGSPEHQQMMQQQQQQMMMEQQKMDQQMQMQMQLMQSQDQREWKKVTVEEARKIHLDGLNMMRDDERAEEQLQHDKVVDMEKMAIERMKANASR